MGFVPSSSIGAQAEDIDRLIASNKNLANVATRYQWVSITIALIALVVAFIR